MPESSLLPLSPAAKPDPDRQRAINLVLTDATQRILSVSEVKSLHNAIIAAEPSRREFQGLGIQILENINNGHVLTYTEAQAVAQAIDEIWLEKPLSAEKISGNVGVRDERAVCHACSTRCGSSKSSCPECSACSFDLIGGVGGGYVRNSLSGNPAVYRVSGKESDCGCGKK